MNEQLVIGLMSGTSVDGIDAALVRIRGGQGDGPIVRLMHFERIAFPEAVRAEIFRLFDPSYATAQRTGAMHALLGELYAKAALFALRQAHVDPGQIACIASHGQTIWHAPLYEDYCGFKVHYTVQLGDGAVIATRSGIPTISDFRPHDMALGGQGAPLVPFTEYMLYRADDEGRLLLNLGGIANVTAIPLGAGPEDVRAFDTGPANMLIDGAMQRLFSLPMDEHGQAARRGQTHQPLLAWLLDDPYYHLPPPKSTGREAFGSHRLNEILQRADGVPPEDIIATLTQLTARTIFDAYTRFVQAAAPVHRVIAAGGGSYNLALMDALREQFAALGIPVDTGETLNIHGDAKEAVAFALLGALALGRNENNLPSVTGASRATVMGKISYP